MKSEQNLDRVVGHVVGVLVVGRAAVGDGARRAVAGVAYGGTSRRVTVVDPASPAAHVPSTGHSSLFFLLSVLRRRVPNAKLTLLLTLCGLTSQKTHRGGPGLGGSVHQEAHPCFPCFVQPSFTSIDAGSIYHPLVQLIPSINAVEIRQRYRKFSRFSTQLNVKIH